MNTRYRLMLLALSGLLLVSCVLSLGFGSAPVPVEVGARVLLFTRPLVEMTAEGRGIAMTNSCPDAGRRRFVLRLRRPARRSGTLGMQGGPVCQGNDSHEACEQRKKHPPAPVPQQRFQTLLPPQHRGKVSAHQHEQLHAKAMSGGLKPVPAPVPAHVLHLDLLNKHQQISFLIP